MKRALLITSALLVLAVGLVFAQEADKPKEPQKYYASFSVQMVIPVFADEKKIYAELEAFRKREGHGEFSDHQWLPFSKSGMYKWQMSDNRKNRANGRPEQVASGPSSYSIRSDGADVPERWVKVLNALNETAKWPEATKIEVRMVVTTVKPRNPLNP